MVDVRDARWSRRARHLLDRVASRGLDVRIIFWRPDVVTTGHARNAFWGAAEHRALLDRRRSGVKVRWDRAHRGFCQHQKTWMIDAGGERVSRLRVASISTPTRWLFLATAESESITMCTSRYLARRPVDAHHNFVRRWNEVSERIACNGRWGSGSEDDRAFPTRLPKPCGAASSEWGGSSDRAGCEDAEQVALFPLQPFVRRARLLHRSVVLDDPIVERLHDVRK